MQSATQLPTGISASISSVKSSGTARVIPASEREHADHTARRWRTRRRRDLTRRERERRDRPALELTHAIEVAAEIAGEVVAHQERQERDQEHAGAAHAHVRSGSPPRSHGIRIAAAVTSPTIESRSRMPRGLRTSSWICRHATGPAPARYGNIGTRRAVDALAPNAPPPLRMRAKRCARRSLCRIAASR